MPNRFNMIMHSMHEHYEEAKSLNHTLLAVVLQGSQNYNLDVSTPDYQSDVDTKAIILPSFEDFVYNKSPLSHTHIRENNEHIDLKDIRILFDTFKKQNMNFIEILFSDFYLVDPDWEEEWQELRNLGERLAKCHPAQALKTMSGMSMEKFKALCHPYPSIKYKIDKWGYDGKQLHHIIRVNDFMHKFIQGAPYKECLIPEPYNMNKLRDAKLNRYSLEEALKLAKKYDDENRRIKDKYIEEFGEELKDPQPYKDLDNLKFRILKKHFKNQLLEG